MTPEELKALKESLKKNPVVEKPEKIIKEKKVKKEKIEKKDKEKAPKSAFKVKRLIPYTLITIAFFLSVFLIALLMDKMIIPSFVNERGTAVTPDLIKMKIDEAEKVLEMNNLHGEITKEQFTTKYPAGTVINQTPRPGKSVKSGRAIFLTVSKGQDSIKVPWILGRTYREAEVTLLKYGLELGDTTYQNSDEYSRHTVMEQKPKGGKYLPYSSKVNLVFSKGPDHWVEVPNLVGFEIENMDNILLESKLSKGKVDYVYENDSFLPYTIVEQDPPAGEFVAPESFIHVKVYIESNITK